jgi:hypothetical protein
MRVFIAISVVVASISAASAQSAIDPGGATNAAAEADSRGGAPAELASDQTSFYVAGAGIVKIVARSAEDLKAEEAGQAAWAARCRPIVVEDRDGLRRVRYAERDCDLSNFNTAGN